MAPSRGKGPGTSVTTTVSRPRVPEPSMVLNEKVRGVELPVAVKVPLNDDQMLDADKLRGTLRLPTSRDSAFGGDPPKSVAK